MIQKKLRVWQDAVSLYVEMRSAKFGFKTNLSAWVTAFIEAYPDTGIEEIATLYFKKNDLYLNLN
jgi:hypothetical protein